MCELMSVIRGENAIQFCVNKDSTKNDTGRFLYIIIEGEGFPYYL